MKRMITTLVSLAVLAGCASSGSGGNAAAPSIAERGKPAPAWSEPTIAGSTLSMASLEGKPVYLNFFASWCPPCNDEAPQVNAIAGEFAPKGLQVIGVDVSENAAKAKKFVDEHHLTYPAVIDSGTLRDAYRINGMPVHVFIDRAGIVKKIEIGQLSKDQMIADVKSIL